MSAIGLIPMRSISAGAAPALVALALGACSGKGAAASTPSGPANMKSDLELRLTVDPDRLRFSERASFKIGFAATNRGSAPIDPRLDDAVLTANGQRVFAWDLAIQNGARDATWTQLPPGKSIEMAWPLGEAIFEQPGRYELVLTLHGHLATASVEVIGQ